MGQRDDGVGHVDKPERVVVVTFGYPWGRFGLVVHPSVKTRVGVVCGALHTRGARKLRVRATIPNMLSMCGGVNDQNWGRGGLVCASNSGGVGLR